MFSIDASKSAQVVAQLPPYEDRGVRYQGYSKRLVGTDAFEITPQTKIYLKDDNANTTADNLLYTIPPNKKLYISTVAIFSYDSVLPFSTTRLYDGSSALPSVFRGTIGNYQTIVFNFAVPLEFLTSVIWKMGDNKTQIYLDLWGWLEDK